MKSGPYLKSPHNREAQGAYWSSRHHSNCSAQLENSDPASFALADDCPGRSGDRYFKKYETFPPDSGQPGVTFLAQC